jgi:alpha-L-fucosidase
MPQVNRREFIASSGAMAALSAFPLQSLTQGKGDFDSFPEKDLQVDSPYVEHDPIPGYHHAPTAAYEAFRDMKFGARIHWGIYSIWHRGAESWPFLKMSLQDRYDYNELYKTWNPSGFDAASWISAFKESGMKMFAFTSKHHEGFSMFDTKTRVKSRTNWAAKGGPRMEECDLAYSIMETPFKRDIVKELTDAAHRQGIKIDLYFSHPDWYDADFRPYAQHPLQVPSSKDLMVPWDYERVQTVFRDNTVLVPDPTDHEVKRMMERHRSQLVELVSNYGTIDMVCLDICLGPKVWPELRKTIMRVREIQPNIMLRNRGIGNYGDYYTPERVIPGSTVATTKPWFCIYPLGSNFSFEPYPAKYKGAKWIIDNLVDTVAKGGGLMVGVGPNANGELHTEAIRQMKEVGKWLRTNGEAIYATRPRDGVDCAEGDHVRFTRSKDNRFVYAILTEWPGRALTLASVRPKDASNMTMLGSSERVEWSVDSARGCVIRLSENLQSESNRPCNHAWSLKIQVG